MSPKNVKKKKIEPINYFYALLIIVGCVLLVLYIFKWRDVKQEEKLMNSYLISSNTIQNSVKDLDSLNLIRQEAPSSYFIYLSYHGDEKIYELEEELKPIIDKYDLNDIFYYVDLTKLKEDDGYLDKVNDALDVKDIENIPAIIYVNEGKINKKDILDGTSDSILSVSELENLLELYEFDAVK